MSIAGGLPEGGDRRKGERRKGERRSVDRGGPDRRKGDRRASGAAAVLSFAVVAAAPTVGQADIFTRRNAKGVIEATNFPNLDGYTLTYRSKGVVIHSPGFRPRPSGNREYDAFIVEAAALHRVSTELVRAVIQVESQFDARAISSAGAQGLMQLMPDTARRLGVSDAFDPRQNIFGGVKYLRILLDMFKEDVALAVAGYNAGENAVIRHRGVPPYKETQGYVRKIQALLASGPPPEPTAAATPAPALFITPGDPDPAPNPAATGAATRPRAARRRVIYKWTDATGRLRLSYTPPSGGIHYVVVPRTAD